MILDLSQALPIEEQHETYWEKYVPHLPAAGFLHFPLAHLTLTTERDRIIYYMDHHRSESV